jgi:hypothetical protein
VPDSVRLPARLREPALVAASQAYTAQEFRGSQLFNNMPWQYEAWGFRRTLGEFNQAMDWTARAMSRIRLGAAEIIPGGDEPEMLHEGPAADLMESFCGGPPGHSAFLSAITPHLEIPGEGWLIAERDDPRMPLSQAEWGVYSTECLYPLGPSFKVRVGESQWRELAPDNLPMRIYQPDPQYPWLATSNAEAAVPIMRRIFLIDSRIVAMMVSRLVMNGIMLIPAEGTFGVPAQYQDAPDPFVATLMDIAARNIANPGNASAGIPIPIKFTADLIEKWRLFKAEDPLDEWLLKERDDELGRLGDTLGIARERVAGGTGQLNHWNSWQVAEEEIKITFAPLAETICGAITKAFLVPMLRQAGAPLVGPRGGRIIAWYDTSELTIRPDLAEPALALYNVGVISEEALRRETGFSETDAPTGEELETWVWKKVAGSDTLAATAAQHLSGAPLAGTVALPAASGGGNGATAPTVAPAVPANGPPQTRAEPPPAPGAQPIVASAIIKRTLSRAGVLREHVNGYDRG